MHYILVDNWIIPQFLNALFCKQYLPSFRIGCTTSLERFLVEKIKFLFK